jgi:hypothetical protein
MPNALYVCLQDEDKIATFGMNGETGTLTRQADVPASGGPPAPTGASCMSGIAPRRRSRAFGSTRAPAG